MPRRVAGLAVALLAAAPPIAAQAPLTLDAAIREALRANADLALARARVDSAHGERTIARAMPGVSLASVPQVPWQYSLSVPADIGPQRMFRTSAASAGLRAAEFDAKSVTLDVIFAVRLAFADVALAESVREITRADRVLYTRILAADSARLAAGDIPVREVTKAEVELVRADAALAAAGQAGIVRLLTILEDEVRSAMGLTGVTSYDQLNSSFLYKGAPMVAEPRVHSVFPLLNLDDPGYGGR
mgnify:CR=1 FL=1